MAEYTATIQWQRDGAAFTDNRFSRAHVWRFDGGAEVPASASPHIVRPPLSDPAAVDPEEALIASLSSCHMLVFLHLAAKSGYTVESYTDDAIGILEKNAQGKLAITQVTLRPKTEFVGDKRPDEAGLNVLHDKSHEECFIANSVKTEVRCEPRL